MTLKMAITCVAIAACSFNASAQDEKAPPPPPKQQIVNDNLYHDFLKRNPGVKDIHMQGSGRVMVFELRSGKKEVYNLENKNELTAAEAKYGFLPEPPPPPPSVPEKPSKPGEPVILGDEPSPAEKAGEPGNYLPAPPKKKLPPPPPGKKGK